MNEVKNVEESNDEAPGRERSMKPRVSTDKAPASPGS